MPIDSEQPYKGLASYAEVDAGLFAGRDADIRRCAIILSDSNTRILALHGLTGCGKSSFLRAGIIPFLEQEDSGARIGFARRGASRDVFISSTADPLAKLANAVFEFTRNEITIRKPTGETVLNLQSALPEGADDAAVFVRSAGRDSSVLLGVLERLSLILPKTLVLIVDQGEEVLTLNPGVDVSARDAFFEFLSSFSTSQFAMKILVSLRTEYLGRFVSHLRLGFRGTGISDYYLGELTRPQIKDALLRPAKKFHFSIEDEVIDNAIAQLHQAPIGRLGALQITFSELYALMRERGKGTIERTDLAELGDVQGTIERFVHKALFDRGIAVGLSPVNAEHEANRWKEVLCDLTRPQPDGTVTTDIKPITEIAESLADNPLGFEATTRMLLSAGLLKPVNIVDLDGKLVPCFGIGHDTVGLVLRNWKRRREEQSRISPVEGSAHAAAEERPSSKDRDIALCLSGGGYRSMLFDIGAVKRLNELGLLPKLGRVSSVAGGAIAAGVLAMQWKKLSFASGVATNFDELMIRPLIKLAGETIDFSIVRLVANMVFLPEDSAAMRLSNHLEGTFGQQLLKAAPEEPVFVFSTTNLQQISLFRLSGYYIGNEEIGRIREPKLKLATAVAAANALPPILAPLILKLRNETWEAGKAGPEFRDNVYLATGSIIDNLAIEAAWIHHQTILICDGGMDSPDDPKPEASAIRRTARAVEAVDHQLRVLRRRQIAEAFQSKSKNGAFWSMQRAIDGKPKFDPQRAKELAQLSIRLEAMAEQDRRDLIDLGYAACDAAMEDWKAKPAAAP